jgi:hypothetical protein
MTVASRVDLFLHLGLLWDMWPICDHGHDAVGPNADQDVRPIANLFAHMGQCRAAAFFTKCAAYAG